MVSIITPTHYKPKLFNITVESVMQQTCGDFEWVVLDNSPEHYFTKDFSIFMENHPEYGDVCGNVKIFEMPHSDEARPVGYYKNICASLTTCGNDDFILVLDHDDLITRTTVEDIVKCDEKYKGLLDYMTGFAICLIYDSEKNVFQLKNNFNADLTVRMSCIEPITIGSDFKLPIEHFQFPQYVNLDYKYLVAALNSHPRAIKKRLLNINVFKFHENSMFEEDTPQVYLASLFFNIGWIARPTVCYILYKEGEEYKNSCIHKVFDLQSHIDNETLKKAMALIYEGVRNIVGDNTINKMFLYDDFAFSGTLNPSSEWLDTINNLKESCFR